MDIKRQIIKPVCIVYAVLFCVILAIYIVNPFNNKCIKGDCVNGHGLFVWNSGKQYEGEWKNGMRHGQGTLSYPGFYILKADFKKNRMNGKGTKLYLESYRKGSRYTGEWKNGLEHGMGTMTSSSGFKYYVGEWKNGLKHGKGTLKNPSGYKYEGGWKNNKMHGQGVSIEKDGSKCVGEWKNDKIYNARGTKIIDADGNKYEGQWKNGKMFGEGTMIHPDGRKYKGRWVNGEFVVKGTN